MKFKVKFAISALTAILFLASCKEEAVVPKPNAQLRLEFPKTQYGNLDAKNFQFSINEMAKVNSQDENSITLDYPIVKGSIFITYKKVEDNLNSLMRDAHKLSGEHAAKADGIQQRVFTSFENKVYGAFYEVSGDAASQAQFFVTDSLNHFVTGALYFKTKPNYDSIYPAAKYLQNDMGRIMETLRWK